MEMDEGGEGMNGPVEVYHTDEAGGSMRNTSGVLILQLKPRWVSWSCWAQGMSKEREEMNLGVNSNGKQEIFTNLRLLTTFNY
jgi:hypothetical protein